MNLLPKSRDEFGSKTYWEDFFRKRKDVFEWYGEYIDLCGIINKYCKKTDHICMVGCGNSALSDSMYDAGYEDIINIDISETVIKKMSNQNKTRAKMKYLVMDVKNTSFDGVSFNVIFDKGTLDAIFTDMSVKEDIYQMFNEITRILKIGGRYICVSLAQGHILRELLSYFSHSWFIRVHHVEIGSSGKNNGLGSKLPVFAFIFTKVKSTLSKPVLEFSVSESSKLQKYENAELLSKSIENLQEFAVLQNKLESSTLSEELSFDLYSETDSEEPRYSVTVIDTPKSKLSSVNGDYGVFIVPNGHENEDTYTTAGGRHELVQAAGFCRLSIVTLHRGHVYQNIDEIKGDLNAAMMQFAPKDLKSQIPYVTTSSEMSQRSINVDTTTQSFGRVMIEDIQMSEGNHVRYFIKADQKDQVLCKAKLMIDKSSKKKAKLKRRICDHRYLLTTYQKCIFGALVTLCKKLSANERTTILCIGMSNMCLVQFLMDLHEQIYITFMGVEQAVLELAEKYFGLKTQESRLIISDDLDLSSKDSKYDIIILDDEMEKKSKNLNAKKMKLKEISELLEKSGVLITLKDEACTINNYLNRIFTNTFSIQCTRNDQTLVVASQCVTLPNESDTKLAIENLQGFMNKKRTGFYQKDEWNLDLEFKSCV